MSLFKDKLRKNLKALLKLEYIAKNSTNSAYRTNKHFQLKNAEIARLVGGDEKYALYKATYSLVLREYLNTVNKQLLNRKNEYIKIKNISTKNKTKPAILEKYDTQKNVLKN